MYQLVYTSRAEKDFSDEDLKRLLLRARLRNSGVGVTGMLVYYGGRFLQLLEGDETAVEATFARIADDTRHVEIHVLGRGELFPTRVFGDWSMGFLDGGGAAKILKGYVALAHDPNLATLDRSNALGLLLALRRDEASEPSRNLKRA